MMKRVVGIGGVFFKAKDQKALLEWYKNHLGIDVQSWGGTTFERPNNGDPLASQPTAWRVGETDDEAFEPSSSSFMINYLVDDLAALLKVLRDEDCEVIGEFDEGEFGKFGWVLDPEGNKIELWEPAKNVD